MDATLLQSSGLLRSPSFRRLFKSRHQDATKLEIRADSMHVCLRSDLATNFTVYKLQVRSTVRWGDGGEWALEKRYAEFAIFRARLLKLAQRWDAMRQRRSGYKDEKLAAALLLISNALRRPLECDFPRKHMRRDTAGIIRERMDGLPPFVRALLDTYADLCVFVVNDEPHDEQARQELQAVFEELEAFLDIPKTHKEVQKRQVAAVLKLQDVCGCENDQGGQCPRSCCICLNEFASDDAGVMVQLPCQHHFHEDCVIDWYNTSITCPLCRGDGDGCAIGPARSSATSDASTAPSVDA